MNPVACGERKLGLHRKFLCPIMLSAAIKAFQKGKRQRKEIIFAHCCLN
jgi:hypothetical protein